MKSTLVLRPTVLLVASLIVATGLTLGISLSSGAADAPRKGAERLTQSDASFPVRASAVSKTDTLAHSNCGPCGTVVSARASGPAKGGESLAGQGRVVRRAPAHGCDGCSTTLGVAGFGKAKTQVVTHGCSKQVLAAVSCCK